MTDSTTSLGTTRRRGTGAAWSALRHAAGWPVRVYRARALMHQLAGLDAHALRDIGLTPGDLQDTTALAWDADPSLVLRRRSEERRRRR